MTDDDDTAVVLELTIANTPAGLVLVCQGHEGEYSLARVANILRMLADRMENGEVFGPEPVPQHTQN